jgi:hypothetical protein
LLAFEPAWVVASEVLDVGYQAILLKEFYPGEALIVAVTLGFVPYILIRGPVPGRFGCIVARKVPTTLSMP